MNARPDRILADLRILSAPNGDEGSEVILREFQLFLQAGGSISWDFWLSLNPETRILFAEAGNKVARERMLVLSDEACNLAEDSAVNKILERRARELTK